MLDLTRNRDKIIDAAMRLAAKDGWTGLSLDRIAHEAGVGLNDLRKEFSSKADILAAFSRSVDNAVLAKSDPADLGEASRDRLFDVLMTRFELMTPYKSALGRIKDDLQFRPGEGLAQLGIAARSLYWMLAAAGIDAEGSRGALRIPGLMGLYGRVFDIWLEDDDPGLARTMASLDSRLRRGERAMQRIDDFNTAASRFCAGLLQRGKRRAKADPQTEEEPASPATPATTPGQTNGSAEPGSAPTM